jgi:hypothetical protein
MTCLEALSHVPQCRPRGATRGGRRHAQLKGQQALARKHPLSGFDHDDRGRRAQLRFSRFGWDHPTTRNPHDSRLQLCRSFPKALIQAEKVAARFFGKLE